MATLQADKDTMTSKCDVLEEELYSSKLLLESQNIKIVEELKGEIDEKTTMISTLKSQLQCEQTNHIEETKKECEISKTLSSRESRFGRPLP